MVCTYTVISSPELQHNNKQCEEQLDRKYISLWKASHTYSISPRHMYSHRDRWWRALFVMSSELRDNNAAHTYCEQVTLLKPGQLWSSAWTSRLLVFCLFVCACVCVCVCVCV